MGLQFLVNILSFFFFLFLQSLSSRTELSLLSRVQTQATIHSPQWDAEKINIPIITEEKDMGPCLTWQTPDGFLGPACTVHVCVCVLCVLCVCCVCTITSPPLLIHMGPHSALHLVGTSVGTLSVAWGEMLLLGVWWKDQKWGTGCHFSGVNIYFPSLDLSVAKWLILSLDLPDVFKITWCTNTLLLFMRLKRSLPFPLANDKQELPVCWLFNTKQKADSGECSDNVDFWTVGLMGTWCSTLIYQRGIFYFV